LLLHRNSHWSKSKSQLHFPSNFPLTKGFQHVKYYTWNSNKTRKFPQMLFIDFLPCSIHSGFFFFFSIKIKTFSISFPILPSVNLHWKPHFEYTLVMFGYEKRLSESESVFCPRLKALSRWENKYSLFKPLAIRRTMQRHEFLLLFCRAKRVQHERLLPQEIVMLIC
jgi:hypothetical protein